MMQPQPHQNVVKESGGICKRDESPSSGSTGGGGLVKEDVSSFAQASTLLRGTAARYAQNKQGPQQWIRPPRILLVEDDAVCLGLSARLLKLFGCHLDVATDGYSAVAKLTDNKYDMVLMDVGLPGMDGVQAAARIRSFDHHTPIVTMTGHTTANDCITYLSTGMNDILAKPFRKETLWEMLEKHCRHLEMRLPAITAEEFFPQEMPSVAKEAEELNEINGLSLSGVKRPRGGGI